MVNRAHKCLCGGVWVVCMVGCIIVAVQCEVCSIDDSDWVSEKDYRGNNNICFVFIIERRKMFRIVYFRGLYRYRNFLKRFQYIVECFWSDALVAVSCEYFA